jgi:RIO kinase 2
MYLSRLAAQKEFAVMKVLHREGFTVPEPIAWSRHTVVMEFVDAWPLRMVEGVPEPGKLYAELMGMVVALAKRGLIHGDFNEFNILIKEIVSEKGGEEKIVLQPVLIDFPQAVSTNHSNAEMYFDRDVGCVKRYFERRFKYVCDEEGPFFKDAVKGIDPEMRLDIEVEASGFSKKMAKDLERFVEGDGGDRNELEAEKDSQEVDVENQDEVELEEDEDGLPEDPQVDDPRLAEEIGGLAIGDDLAVKPMSGRDFGLMPLEIQHDPDVAAEKLHNKKKAAGWAI